MTLMGASLTCMSQAEGPEPEVRGGVGNAAQAVFDRVDGLMHEYVSKIELKENCYSNALGTFYRKGTTNDTQISQTDQ